MARIVSFVFSLLFVCQVAHAQAFDQGKALADASLKERQPGLRHWPPMIPRKERESFNIGWTAIWFIGLKVVDWSAESKKVAATN
jgi:hypothetical protein